MTTHPSIESLPGVGGFDEVIELHDAVSHKVIISNWSVVENGHLDLLPVRHVEAELLVVSRRVGLLFGMSLSNFVVVHLHYNVRVQSHGGFVEDDRVAEGEGGRLQVHRLSDPEPQVTAEFHLW